MLLLRRFGVLAQSLQESRKELLFLVRKPRAQVSEMLRHSGSQVPEDLAALCGELHPGDAAVGLVRRARHQAIALEALEYVGDVGRSDLHAVADLVLVHPPSGRKVEHAQDADPSGGPLETVGVEQSLS